MFDKKIGSQVMFWIGDTIQTLLWKSETINFGRFFFSQTDDKHIWMINLKIGTFSTIWTELVHYDEDVFHCLLQEKNYKKNTECLLSRIPLSTISGGTELAAGFTNGNRDNIKQWWSNCSYRINWTPGIHKITFWRIIIPQI